MINKLNYNSDSTGSQEERKSIDASSEEGGDILIIKNKKNSGSVELKNVLSIPVHTQAKSLNDNNKFYIIYKVVNLLNNQLVWRRYNDFVLLSKKLKMGNIKAELPGPKYFGSFKKKFLDERQKKLELWLNEVFNKTLYENESNNSQNETIINAFLNCSNQIFESHFPAQLSSPLVENCLQEDHELEEKINSKTTTKDNENNDGKPISLQNFKSLQVIGKGSFGNVILVKLRNREKLYAMKIIHKNQLKTARQIEHAKAERRILGKINHPFIVDLNFAFQTKTRLFLVLEFVPGGEIFYHQGKMKKFPESIVKLWSAEIILALDYLHNLGIVFRDMKPENIVLDKEGHIKLIDFGLCKDEIDDYATGTTSFCGTPEYIAPEILVCDKYRNYGKAVDFWSLGSLIYEMISGLPPWYTHNKRKLFYYIRNAPLKFSFEISDNAKDLIGKFMTRDPSKRLGSNGIEEIREQPFFCDLDFDLVLKRKINSEFIPKFCNEDSLASNIDECFRGLKVKDVSCVKSNSSKSLISNSSNEEETEVNTASSSSTTPLSSTSKAANIKNFQSPLIPPSTSSDDKNSNSLDFGFENFSFNRSV